jgi:predicted AlkP superfamily phosphohydrolase/phosphomutase
MFWRLLDPQHPAYDAKLAARFGSVIEETYIAMDRILERTLRRVDKDTVLFVISDHGFNPFRRGFNLNTWLVQNGYHILRDPRRQEEASFFDNTLWGRTKAYGIGLNGLYINQRGRERDGVVASGVEKDILLGELVQKLEAVVDPLTGERAILRAFIAKDTYRGPYLEAAPDIILGFNRGYRISWASPLGGFPKDIFEDNRQKWSGDHMSAPETLWASLVVNRKVRAASPALYDITATILDLFGAEKSPGMIGSSICA